MMAPTSTRDFGEPWRMGRLGGSVVTDRHVRDDHICGREACDDLYCFHAYGGWLLFESCTPAIAERIMLCVNALAGVSNETLIEHVARGGYARSR